MKSKLFIAFALLALLAGCASKQTEQMQLWSQAEQSRQQRLDTMAATCQTDLCVVMVAQEATRGAAPIPQERAHPVWNVLDRAIGIAVPAYMGVRQSQAWADALVGVTGSITSMDRAYNDSSVHIGGDNIGGDRINDRSISSGGDLTGGDRVNDSSVNAGGDQVGGDQWHGSEYADTCVGDECSSQSPVDNSDSSDNSDNSSSESETPVF